MKFQDVFKQELGWVLPRGGLADSVSTQPSPREEDHLHA